MLIALMRKLMKLMKQRFVKCLRACEAWLSQFTKPHQDELVLSLILHTASLELKKHEHVELAPVKGTCGPFKLSGNSLPVFEYKVFEKEIMEFIAVRVEISRPDRIEYQSKIDSTTAPERHGEAIETRTRYREPFERLSLSLFKYFPLYRKEAA